MTNESIRTFILMLHNTAIGNLREDPNTDIFVDRLQSRSRIVIKQGDNTMINYYDGFSSSMPYRTVVKSNNKIVFHKFDGKDPRTDSLPLNQSVAMVETLSNPGNSFTVSGALVRLR